MKLHVRNGKLSWGSIYKLFAIGWTVTWTTFSGIIMLLMVLVILISGAGVVNGEMIQGRFPALVALIPMIVLFPVIIFLQSFIFAGFLTAGVWLYSTKRSIILSIEET